MSEQLNRLNEYFEFKCWKGLQKRGLSGKKEYEDRLRYEITTITKMGFAGYFLIVADFLNWARSKDIPVGPGRGSAAGSLASYCIGITDIDPIRFNLLFERFLNPDRVSMPDIDCDFCEKRRDEVIQYVTNKYGKDYVAQIGTFGQMKAKGAIRDVARTLGHPLTIASKLADLIPPPVHGKAVPLAKSYEQVPALKNYRTHTETPEGETLMWADKLENTIRSYGIHASGVVISPIPLSRIIPLATGSRGEQATQFEMTAVEDVGLIKFDFLGLRTLTMIKLCCDLIDKFHGIKIDINRIHDTDHEDPLVFENLRKGDTCGIFQLETSSGMRDLLIKIIPNEIEDLVALVAMYRPGPLASAGLKMYLDVRAGRRQPEYLFPELEEILKPTSGWIIYQEQVMQIAYKLCGYTKGMVDDLRKAIGKKKEKEMAKHRELFVEGAVKNGYDRTKITKLYDEIEAFGSYAFNKAHAACYGIISYQTAYLKAHYPVEFMCAALTCDYGNVDKVIKYIAECKRLGIKVLPPDINNSDSGFTIAAPTSEYSDGSIGAIRFGLSAIKNLGEEPVSHITSARGSGFRDLLDFAQRVDLGKINRKKLESLVLAGAFDSSGYTRTSMLSAIDKIWDYKQEVKKFEAKSITFAKKMDAWQKRQDEISEAIASGKKKPNPLKKPECPILPEQPVITPVPEMDDQEMLAKEKELLGFYISGHPLDMHSSTLQAFDTRSIDTLGDKDGNGQFKYANVSVMIAGIVGSIVEKQTKKGDTMAFASIEDRSGVIDATIFAGVYAKRKSLLQEGTPILIKGRVEMSGIARDTEEGEDEVAVPKLIVFDVEQLVKGEVRQEPIDIEIDPRRSAELLKLLEKYPGDACQVNVFFKTSSSLFKTNKVFSIGGHRGSFLRDLGRIT